MTLHITSIIARQNVWSVFLWDWLAIDKQVENHLQFIDYLCFMFA